MYRYDDVYLREFSEEFIPMKVDWINNPANNQHLHYDLPLTIENTKKWWEKAKNDPNRYDAVIFYNDVPIGLSGIINIDYKNLKGEDYIIIGEGDYRGKGLAVKAGILCSLYGFHKLGLEKIISYTEFDNKGGLFSDMRRGFFVEGILRRDLIQNGQRVDQFVLGLHKENFLVPREVYLK